MAQIRGRRPPNGKVRCTLRGGFRSRRCLLDGVEVDVEQGVPLITLVLVLLSESDYFAQDLHIEAVALGLCVDVLFIFIQPPDVLLDALDALDEGTKPVTLNSRRSTHGLLLVNTASPMSATRITTSLKHLDDSASARRIADGPVARQP